ncbi:hypothetical protein ACM1RC_04325 [Paenibacillus azoreducens]|uniref:hypothetical protein n=1 Tax=Paenibacillus azoreducens TaxID=116718 RepID=UPI0039F5ED53
MKNRKRKQAKSTQPSPVLGGRITWSRKPMTQVVANKKAEQRRTWCRKGTDDGAYFFVGPRKVFGISIEAYAIRRKEQRNFGDLFRCACSWIGSKLF